MSEEATNTNSTESDSSTKKVIYNWGEESGTEPLVRQSILVYLVGQLNNNNLNELKGDDGSVRTVKVTVELNPPMFPVKS